MTVQLEVGMTAMRRDGERVGPIKASGHQIYAFTDGCCGWRQDGTINRRHPTEIIAAGFPWAELGAQVGDTVCRVWDGGRCEPDNSDFVVGDIHDVDFSIDNLYIIVARAAKRRKRKPLPIAPNPTPEQAQTNAWLDMLDAEDSPKPHADDTVSIIPADGGEPRKTRPATEGIQWAQDECLEGETIRIDNHAANAVRLKQALTDGLHVDMKAGLT